MFVGIKKPVAGLRVLSGPFFDDVVYVLVSGLGLERAWLCHGSQGACHHRKTRIHYNIDFFIHLTQLTQLICLYSAEFYRFQVK